MVHDRRRLRCRSSTIVGCQLCEYPAMAAPYTCLAYRALVGRFSSAHLVDCVAIGENSARV